MAHRFSEITFTPSVEEAQKQFGSYEQMQRVRKRMPDFNRFTERESNFIALRDSFYLASISESGWPYIQHRGGEKGFLKVLSSDRLAFANLSGNAQYQSIGNLQQNEKVSLFLTDYPNRRRLKILGRATTYVAHSAPEQLQALSHSTNPKHKIEAIIEIHLDAFDWNCPQHLTPRFTLDELLDHGIIHTGENA